MARLTEQGIAFGLLSGPRSSAAIRPEFPNESAARRLDQGTSPLLTDDQLDHAEVYAINGVQVA